jgi:hypothetical protein
MSAGEGERCAQNPPGASSFRHELHELRRITDGITAYQPATAGRLRIKRIFGLGSARALVRQLAKRLTETFFSHQPRIDSK